MLREGFRLHSLDKRHVLVPVLEPCEVLAELGLVLTVYFQSLEFLLELLFIESFSFGWVVDVAH